jgi:hypothetical protein
LNECKRSPRIQEAIRLNKLIEPNYESLYVIRPIVHTIIPQALEDIYEESSVYFMFKDKVHTLAKKITTYLTYDNYCMDIVVVARTQSITAFCNRFISYGGIHRS